MGIHTIDNDGNMTWKCQGLGGKCQHTNSVHVNHEAVQRHPEDASLVQMPRCPKCGAQMTVKVSFTEEELKADNMLQYGMVPEQQMLPHAITGEPVPVLIPVLKPIGANPFVARHQKLAELLQQREQRQKETP